MKSVSHAKDNEHCIPEEATPFMKISPNHCLTVTSIARPTADNTSCKEGLSASGGSSLKADPLKHDITGQDVERIFNAIGQHSGMDLEKIAQLRQALLNGQLPMDDRKLSENILEMHRN